jgi:propanediol dehydratase small subunit
LCARVALPTWSRGPSASPLDRRMSAAVPLAVLVAIAAGASIYLFIATRRRMQPYWERSCTGRAWFNEFPVAQSEDIRTFLSLSVSSFGFPRTRALQFAPNDRPLEIYRALNPLKGMPDALELETFAKRLKAAYGLDLVRIWREDITLGEVFAKTTAAV